MDAGGVNAEGLPGGNVPLNEAFGLTLGAPRRVESGGASMLPEMGVGGTAYEFGKLDPEAVYCTWCNRGGLIERFVAAASDLCMLQGVLEACVDMATGSTDSRVGGGTGAFPLSARLLGPDRQIGVPGVDAPF